MIVDGRDDGFIRQRASPGTHRQLSGPHFPFFTISIRKRCTKVVEHFVFRHGQWRGVGSSPMPHPDDGLVRKCQSAILDAVRDVHQRSNRRDLETPHADAFCREQAILQSVQDASGKTGIRRPASHGDEREFRAVLQPNGLGSPAHKGNRSDQQCDARKRG